jgi:hypothetical protein
MITDTLLTMDLSAQWAEEVGKDLQWSHGTRTLLSSQNTWHLLFRESATREPADSQAELVATRPSALENGKLDQDPKVHVVVPRSKEVAAALGGRYILLKKYEGFVVSRTEESFKARLFESPTDYPVLEAEFALEELSETDRELAVDGAAMVWTIGYHYEGSTRKRESMIYFRKLPIWAPKEIEEARNNAEELTSGIQWE